MKADKVNQWLAQIAILDNNVHQFRQGYLDPDRYQRIDSLNLKYLIPLFDALGMKYTTDMAGEVERLRGE